MYVDAVGALGDDSLPPHAASLPPVGFPVAVSMGSESERTPIGQEVTQDGLAMAKLHIGDVEPFHVQDVEQVEVHCHACSPGGLRVTELHAPLEPGEARPAALEGHDLPVQDEVARVLRREGLRDLGIVVVDPELVSGHQPDLPSLAKGQAPLAIALPLVDPGGVGESLFGQRRKHGRRPRRLGAAPHSSPGRFGNELQRILHPAAASISSTVLPERTDSGWDLTGFRRASAASSSIFTRIQRGLFPPPILGVSAYPPVSFFPSSHTLTCPCSTASSTGTSRPSTVSHTTTGPAPYAPSGMS